MEVKFPLVVNTGSKKIEEIGEGDALNLTQNGIAISGSRGIDGQLLKTNGTTVSWGYPSSLYYDNNIKLSVDSEGVINYGNLNVNGNFNLTGNFNLGAKSKPDSNADSGTPGDIKWYADSDGTDAYLYVCVAPNMWKRATLNNFFP